MGWKEVGETLQKGKKGLLGARGDWVGVGLGLFSQDNQRKGLASRGMSLTSSRWTMLESNLKHEELLE